MVRLSQDQRYTLQAYTRKIRQFSKIAYIKRARRMMIYLILKRGDLERRFERNYREQIEELLDQGEDAFAETFRVTRGQMDRLVDRFEDDEEFEGSDEGKQAPVRYQVAVWVYRMAHGEAKEIVAEKFGISFWSNRSFAAILRQAPAIIAWPSQSMRTCIKRQIKKTFGLLDCVGFIDHIHIPIRPVDPANPPQPRRTVYDPIPPSSPAINLLGAVNQDMQFTYLSWNDGFPAYARTLQSLSTLERKPAEHYRTGEYLLGNENFVSTVRIITPFRGEQDELGESQAEFNIKAKEAYKTIQHAFALVRARWNINRAEGMIHAAFCLHNLTVGTWRSFVDPEALEAEVEKAERERVKEPEPEADASGYRNGKLGAARRERLVEKMRS